MHSDVRASGPLEGLRREPRHTDERRGRDPAYNSRQRPCTSEEHSGTQRYYRGRGRNRAGDCVRQHERPIEQPVPGLRVLGVLADACWRNGWMCGTPTGLLKLCMQYDACGMAIAIVWGSWGWSVRGAAVHECRRLLKQTGRHLRHGGVFGAGRKAPWSWMYPLLLSRALRSASSPAWGRCQAG